MENRVNGALNDTEQEIYDLWERLDKGSEGAALIADIAQARPRPAGWTEKDVIYPLRGWVVGKASEVGVPISYVYLPLIVAIGSLLGTMVRIRPEWRADTEGRGSWTVVSNLYGLIIGPPGSKKTTAIKDALKGLFRLQKSAKEHLGRDVERYLDEYERWMIWDANIKAKIKEESKAGPPEEQKAKIQALQDQRTPEPKAPKARTFHLRDATGEALTRVLATNPNGVLVYRDESRSFFGRCADPKTQVERSVYLEAWAGDGALDSMRITRPDDYVETAAVSFIGGIQSEVLRALIQSSIAKPETDDGFYQRWQIMADELALPPKRRGVISDEKMGERRYRFDDGWKTIMNVFEKLSTYDQSLYEYFEEDHAWLPFTAEAQELFNEWHYELLLKRDQFNAQGEETRAGIVAKRASLIPSLALIIHMVHCVVDTDVYEKFPDVSYESLHLAIKLADKISAHVDYVWGFSEDTYSPATRTIARLIKEKKVGAKNGVFGKRDLDQKKKPELQDMPERWAALECLRDMNIIRMRSRVAGNGKRFEVYEINPDVYKIDSVK